MRLVASQFVQSGIDALGLDIVNFGFLTIGIFIYMDPQTYREKFGEAATAASGSCCSSVLRWHSGDDGYLRAAQLMANALISVSTPQTFPVIAWLTGATVNILAPSGGGEWIILGPPILEPRRTSTSRPGSRRWPTARR